MSVFFRVSLLAVFSYHIDFVYDAYKCSYSSICLPNLPHIHTKTTIGIQPSETEWKKSTAQNRNQFINAQSEQEKIQNQTNTYQYLFTSVFAMRLICWFICASVTNRKNCCRSGDTQFSTSELLMCEPISFPCIFHFWCSISHICWFHIKVNMLAYATKLLDAIQIANVCRFPAVTEV